MLSRVLTLTLPTAVFALLIVAANALWLPADVPPPGETLTEEIDVAGPVARFAQSLRFQSVSYLDGTQNDDHVRRLADYLEIAYPGVAHALERHTFEGSSVLYRWAGSDPQRPAVVLAGHFDVAAISERDAAEWADPPFRGMVRDDRIYGRGAIDGKVVVVAVAEAIEHLFRVGFEPEATVYLAFAHDALAGGRGARAIATHLAESGERFATVLDGGPTVVRRGWPTLERSVAPIAVAAKSESVLRLRAGAASDDGVRANPIERVAEAVSRLREAASRPVLAEPVASTVYALARHLMWTERTAVTNQWLFSPLVAGYLAAYPQTRPWVVREVSVRVFEGGSHPRENPSAAEAVVRVSTAPGGARRSAAEWVREVIDDDGIAVDDTTPGSATGGDVPDGGALDEQPYDNEIFDALAGAVRQTFDNTVVVPALATRPIPARHYASLPLESGVYGLTPIELDLDELGLSGGHDEHVRKEALGKAVAFYVRLVRALAGPRG